MKLLLYCTQNKENLWSNDLKHFFLDGRYNRIIDNLPKYRLNGKIVAECDFEVEEIKHYIHQEPEVDVGVAILPEFECDAYHTKTLGHFQLLEKACMKDYSLPNITVNNDLDDYLQGKNGYAIHIKNLKERVMELSDVYKYDNSYNNMFGWLKEENEKYIPLDKAPQNMCRVWIYENGEWVMYILISVRPKWMCLILNKDKDVEARKKVLKEMLEDDM